MGFPKVAVLGFEEGDVADEAEAGASVSGEVGHKGDGVAGVDVVLAVGQVVVIDDFSGAEGAYDEPSLFFFRKVLYRMVDFLSSLTESGDDHVMPAVDTSDRVDGGANPLEGSPDGFSENAEF